MLLRALNQYRGESEAVLPGYAHKVLGFVLEIAGDALGCTLSSQYDATDDGHGKGRMSAPKSLVPNLTRTVKPAPMLACDNASYVFGLAKVVDAPDKQAREEATAQTKQRLFDDLLREYAEEVGDDDARVFLRWRDNGCPGLDRAIEGLGTFDKKRLNLDPIAIQIEASQQLHLKPKAKEFWSKRASAAKSGGAQAVCLSCGEFKPTVDTLPQSLTGSLIPATSTSNVALLSVNFPSASRGASGTGLKSAPVCADCASGAVSAFNELASPGKHRWGGASEDRATIWWSTDDSLDISFLDRPDAAEIKAFYDALDRGKKPLGALEKENIDRFYALTFSGNVARLVIRQWIDLPLFDVLTHVRAWFDHSATPDPDHPYVGVSDMARSCGSFVPSDGMFSAMPDGSRELLIRAALTGKDLPRNLLVLAVSRARAEIHYLSSPDPRQLGVIRRRMNARFALIRLILNRTHLKEKLLEPKLEVDRTEPTYLSGRLFAVRESLQYQALGEVNSSITDRYFERASADPQSVEHALATLEQQHLRTLRRKGRRDAEVALRKQVGELHALRGPAPKRMSAEGQALWIAGYHQQREANIQRATEAKKNKKLKDAPDNEEN